MSTDELEPRLWPAAGDLEKALYSLDLRASIEDSAPQTGAITFGSKQVDATRQTRSGSCPSGDYIALAFDDAFNFRRAGGV